MMRDFLPAAVFILATMVAAALFAQGINAIGIDPNQKPPHDWTY